MVLPKKTTHILRDWTEFERHRVFTAFCGVRSTGENYLSVREIMGAPPENSNEIHLSDEDRKMYLETLCPECLEHDEVALAILGL